VNEDETERARAKTFLGFSARSMFSVDFLPEF
jgi:hypothetical protein